MGIVIGSVLVEYTGYRHISSSPQYVGSIINFVILKAFYPLVLIVSYKFGVHFHSNKKLDGGYSWVDYIYSLPTLYGTS